MTSRLQRYFDRVGYAGPCEPTLEVLTELQALHVCRVPFENLDVQLGRPLTTDADAAYEKIVGNGRGGWCYEQNGLFGWALAEIGFDVIRVAATVMRSSTNDRWPADHLCLLVGMPEDPRGRWLADVGFGGSLLTPIELTEQQTRHLPFRLGLRRLDNGAWQFWEDDGGGEFRFDFVAEAADEQALSDRCEFLQTDPQSSFVLSLVAQIRTRNRHTTLRGRVLTVLSTSGVQRTVLHSASDVVETLRDEFQLDVPEVAALWPRIVARHDELFG